MNPDFVFSSEQLYFSGMHVAYPYLRDYILKHGHQVAPRGEETLEVLGCSFAIADAVMLGVPVGCGRKVGKKMMAIDGSGNLAGLSVPSLAFRVASVLERFSNVLIPTAPDDVIYTSGAAFNQSFLQGAYGPRIGDQLEVVEHQLREDPSTRQAIVTLWREEDRNPEWKDRPCTTEFQLMLREDGLHMFVFMRANDLWTGTCYDVFQFGQIQAAMAHVLDVPVGPYHHYATSLHIYARDFEKFNAIDAWDRTTPYIYNQRETWGPDWKNLPVQSYKSWKEIRAAFTDLLHSADASVDFKPKNQVEDWYWQIMSASEEKQ